MGRQDKTDPTLRWENDRLLNWIWGNGMVGDELAPERLRFGELSGDGDEPSGVMFNRCTPIDC